MNIILWRMRQRVRRLWRRLRGVCEKCGKPRTPRNPQDVHTAGPWCRKCNKSENWARMYGMGPKKLAELLEREQ